MQRSRRVGSTEMAKYEVWGKEESGDPVVLAYVNGDIPECGDTILVRGSVREVDKVFRHHVGAVTTHRVKVGAPLASAEGLPD
jgi:hypothetical protein